MHAPKLAALYSNAYDRNNVHEYALHDALLLHDRGQPKRSSRNFASHARFFSKSERVRRCDTRCVLLNARSIKNKLDEFQAEIVLGENSPCVIGVTETWLDGNVANNIFQCRNQYDIFRKDRNLNGGGVALFSRKNLKATEIHSENFNDLELVAIQARFKKEVVIFVCFYRSSVQQTEILPKLSLAVEYLISKGKPLVLMGDFNLPGISWGDFPNAITLHKQDEFLEMFSSNGLFQTVNLNTRSDAVLDLVFVNEPALVYNVNVSSPMSATCDHNVVNFDLGLRTLQDFQEPIKLRLWSKADVVGIGLSLERMNWPLFFRTCRTVDEIWICFRIFCFDLFEKFVPTVFRTRNRRFRYPKNVNRLIRKKHTAFKNRLRSPVDMAEYKRLSVLCSSAIKQFHHDREREIIDSGRSSVFKFIRSKLSSKPRLNCLERDGQQFTSNKDIARLLCEQYESVFIDDDGTLPSLGNRCETDIPPLFISRFDVVTAINSLKSDSSPGIDKITPWFYKSFPSQLAIPLQIIYNESLLTGEVPKEWRTSLISPIYKGGSKKRTDPASYRPVSLTCIACRIMERIVKKHLHTHLDLYSLISPHQHGFQNKRSTESQLLECKNQWTKSIDSNECVDVIYLDIAKAFDTVSHTKLIAKLKRYGIRGQILTWIKAFLSNRFQAVRVEGSVSDFVPVRSGVPQGSVLGPLLFLLYINDLPEVCRYAILKLFADDSKLYFRCKNFDDYQKLIHDLMEIFKWLSDNQLSVAVEKCVVLHLGTNNPRREYEILGSKLPSVDHIRDVGVEVDQAQKFSDHCQNIAKKANIVSNLFFLTFRSRDKDFMLKFFTSYIRPLLETATTVWNPFLMKDINIIEKVQRRFTKRMPGMFAKTYEHRRAALNLMTLEHRRLRNDVLMVYKLLHGLVDLDFHEFFELNSGRQLRGHSQKLIVSKFHKNCRKYDFSNRCVNVWNSLNQELISSSTLECFKRKLSIFNLSPFLRYHA